MKDKANSPDTQQEADSLRSSCQSLLLSTVNKEGFPEISYAPYVEAESKFYIFISGLAAHTENLLESRVASIMFIEDESLANHAFSRKRITYLCEATCISRDTDSFDNLLDRFQDQFGKLIQTLRGLGDFQLFELTPSNGRYVAGFGKTFEIECSDNQYQQITETSLKSR
jgi:heme iron utilization protein